MLGDGAAAGQVVPVVLQQHQRDRRVLAALVVGVPAPDPGPITAQYYNTLTNHSPPEARALDDDVRLLGGRAAGVAAAGVPAGQHRHRLAVAHQLVADVEIRRLKYFLSLLQIFFLCLLFLFTSQ